MYFFYNNFTAMAFEAIPSVIEKGIIVAQTESQRTSSYFISAPVRIEEQETIVTVLIHKDMNKQRMYLHSVQTKEKLLRSTSLNESAADVKTSELHGKLNARDTPIILSDFLRGNTHEQGHFYLEKSASSTK